MSQLPKYLDLPGDIVGAPPYDARNALMQVLLLKGDRASQQHHLDMILNRASDGALVFHAVTDYVLFSAVYIATLGSLDPIQRTWGSTTEVDLGFWTLARGGAVGREADWSFYWVPTFLFVAPAAAMAAGREVFGYPKTSATISGGRAVDDATASVDVLHFADRRPDARATIETLVRVERSGGGEAANLADFIRFLGLAGIWNGGIGLPLPHVSMPQLMLRQVRDPVDLGRASFREAIVVAAASRTASFGPLPDRWTVTLKPSASHSIGTPLGLAPVSQSSAGFWVRHDFSVGAAIRLWSA